MLLEEIAVIRSAPAIGIFRINNARFLAFRHPCQRRQQGNAVTTGRHGHSGHVRKSSHPVLELAGIQTDSAGNHTGPAYHGRNTHAAFPAIALNAVHHPVAHEIRGILRAVAVIAGTGFIVGAVVGREDNHRIVINAQILKQLDHVLQDVIHPANHRGVAGFRSSKNLMFRVDIGIRRKIPLHPRPSVRSGIAGFIAVFFLPLEAAVPSQPRRIGTGGSGQTAVGSRESQIQEERPGRSFLMVVHNPLFGAGPEQIRIIGGARNFRADALPRRSRGLVTRRQIMVMPRQMLDDSVKIIKPAHVGSRGQSLAALSASAHAPFPDGRRMVTRAFQQRSQRMGILDRVIKRIVAHHPGMPLVNAQQQGSAGRSAYRSRTVMAPQLHALRRHRVQRRRLEFIPAGHLPAVFILLRPVDAHIPPAHVIHQDKNNVGPGSGNMRRHVRLFRYIRLQRQPAGCGIIIP